MKRSSTPSPRPAGFGRTPSSRARAVVAGLLALVTVTGCSVSTGPDEIAVQYDSGPFSDTTFDACVQPGNRDYHGPGDQAYVYPAGQRTYRFTTAEDAESAPISIVSKDNLALEVTGIVTFSLNTECDTLQRFHERIGLKYGADEEDGWERMLYDYVGQPLDRAMDAAAKDYAWKDLYNNAELKQEWEEKVGEYAAQFIEEQSGGSFFCAPNYVPGEGQECGDLVLTLQQPQPPEDVRNALAAAQEAIERNEAQKAENARVATELEAIEDLVDVLGPEGYVLYKALENGDIEVIPVPAGGGVNITPRADQ
ncbi:SPFH domain-containing protein [Marinactinospora thermotolerans]|nr:SPFH domain-containing protein [Marinactinospora thermotolerans]